MKCMKNTYAFAFFQQILLMALHGKGPEKKRRETQSNHSSLVSQLDCNEIHLKQLGTFFLYKYWYTFVYYKQNYHQNVIDHSFTRGRKLDIIHSYTLTEKKFPLFLLLRWSVHLF